MEAVLFASPDPVPPERLAELLDLPDATIASEWVGLLRDRYAADDSGISLDAVAGGYQFRTRPEVAPWLVRLKQTPAHHRLPPTLLETLAVIAHRQPVTRADVEAVRGVACGEPIKILMGKGLVRTAGRHPSLGRPQLYATTKRFLQHFGLDTLADLPAAPEG